MCCCCERARWRRILSRIFATSAILRGILESLREERSESETEEKRARRGEGGGLAKEVGMVIALAGAV